MAIVPKSAAHDVQGAFIDVNRELRELTDQVNALDSSKLTRLIEELRSDIEFLKRLRRIPAPGYRAPNQPLGPLYLNDSLFWSSPTAAGYSVTVSLVNTSSAVTDTQYIILVDATSGNITITLPAAIAGAGRMLEIKKIDATSNKVIIDAAGSDTIDGETSQELLYEDEALPIVSDGTSEWLVL